GEVQADVAFAFLQQRRMQLVDFFVVPCAPRLEPGRPHQARDRVAILHVAGRVVGERRGAAGAGLARHAVPDCLCERVPDVSHSVRTRTMMAYFVTAQKPPIASLYATGQRPRRSLNIACGESKSSGTSASKSACRGVSCIF